MGFIGNIINKINEAKAKKYYNNAEWIEFGLFPQTVKADNVQIVGAAELDEHNNNGPYTVYKGDDDNYYFLQTVLDKVTLFDGKKHKRGENLYFKYEPLVYEIGNHIYVKNNSKSKHYEKTNNVYYITKNVVWFSGVSKPIFDLDPMEVLLFNEDEAKYKGRLSNILNFRTTKNMAYNDIKKIYSLNEKVIGKGDHSKQPTDFAKALTGINKKSKGMPYGPVGFDGKFANAKNHSILPFKGECFSFTFSYEGAEMLDKNLYKRRTQKEGNE